MKRFLRLGLLATVLMVPAQAHAVSLGLGIGAGYWFEGAPQFDFQFRVEQPLGRRVALGLRPGIVLNVRPAVELGVPIDAYFRVNISRFYIDLIGGLWVLFGQMAPLRAHIAIGFGVHFGSFSLGIEAGYLQNGAQLLARFTFTF